MKKKDMYKLVHVAPSGKRTVKYANWRSEITKNMLDHRGTVTLFILSKTTGRYVTVEKHIIKW